MAEFSFNVHCLYVVELLCCVVVNDYVTLISSLHSDITLFECDADMK